MNQIIELNSDSIRASHGGLFISRGLGIHEIRTIDYFEMILVVSGTLYMFEEDVKFQVPKGYILFLYPSRRHGGYVDYSADLSFYWFHFYADFAQKTDSRENVITLKQLCKAGRPDKLTELLRDFFDNQSGKRNNQKVLDLLARLMLYEVRDFADVSQTDSSNQVLASKINVYIKTHFNHAISTRSIADEFQYNPNYIERIYKDFYDKTISREINEARISFACNQLINSTMNISQISQMSGFNNVGYFYRTFKNMKGVNPTNYRKNKSALIFNTE